VHYDNESRRVLIGTGTPPIFIHQLNLLTAARIGIINKHGMGTQVLALLNQGSEISFISKSIVQLLALLKRRFEVMLTGIGKGVLQLKE
jgi:hypothetical protein